MVIYCVEKQPVVRSRPAVGVWVTIGLFYREDTARRFMALFGQRGLAKRNESLRLREREVV